MAVDTFFTKVQVDALFRHIKKGADNFLKSVSKKWQKIGHEEIGWIVKNEMSGRPGIRRKSGSAARALQPYTEIQGVNVVHRWIAGGPAAKYLPVHQYGATITAKGGGMLAFNVPITEFNINKKGNVSTRKAFKTIMVKSVYVPKRLHIVERFEVPGNQLRINAVLLAMEELDNGKFGG